MSKRFKLAILIERAEPFHNGHLENYFRASELAGKVHIFLGSAYQPRTIKNPFVVKERIEMITSVIDRLKGPVGHYSNVRISPVCDYYNNNTWISDIQRLVLENYPDIEDKDIAIIGYDKDDSSWYNHAFPEWKFISLNGYVEYGSQPIDATKIRELMFEGNLDFVSGAVPGPVFEYLLDFTKTEIFKTLVEEYNFIKEYKRSWIAAPFAPTFMCTDAVVIQGGHILMIQRGFAPGKGLWALPGGFLNQKETTEDGCIRELLEETKIKVPEVVLRKAITHRELFDAPDRSLRGRTLTHAFLIELDGGDGSLPRVKGSDDAKKAKWFKLAEVAKMGEVIFEDHAHIIALLVARAKK